MEKAENTGEQGEIDLEMTVLNTEEQLVKNLDDDNKLVVFLPAENSLTFGDFEKIGVRGDFFKF